MHVEGDEVGIEDTAIVENCILRDNAHIYGNARVGLSVAPSYLVNDIAYIPSGLVVVGGSSSVFGNAVVDNKMVSPDITLSLEGDCKFGGDASTSELACPEDYVVKYGADKVKIKKSNEFTWDYYNDLHESGILVVLTDVWDMG